MVVSTFFVHVARASLSQTFVSGIIFFISSIIFNPYVTFPFIYKAGSLFSIPYIYFNDYLKSNTLFLAQYYLNLKFFLSGLRKDELLFKNIFRWRDAGLIVAIALILYSVKEYEEAEKYLNKLTQNIHPLKDRIMTLYSIYYLQKLL